jgi:hypothetical protein
MLPLAGRRVQGQLLHQKILDPVFDDPTGARQVLGQIPPRRVSVILM